MPPNEHSEYSPSGMAAKILCPGSHLATKGIKSTSGLPAAQGTECHEWAEKLLLDTTAPMPDFKADWQEDCTRDMVGQALQVIEDLSLLDDDVQVHVEEVVDLGWISSVLFDMSQIYGTCDVLIYSPATKTLVVLDYKTGMGPVDPKWNAQLMIYALGAMGGFEVDQVVIAVAQPRVYEDLQTWNTTPDELTAWAKGELIPALVVMSQPGAPFCPGEKQCQWCLIKGWCQAQKTELLGLIDSVPMETLPILTDQEINDLLLRTGEIKKWIDAVRGVAQARMEAGADFVDFKLVRGRSSRAWTDEEAADKFLTNQKLKDKERHTHKLLTPPQAEKVLKEKLKKTVTLNRFNSLVKKSEGKITYALRSSNKPEVVIDPVSELVDLEDLF